MRSNDDEIIGCYSEVGALVRRKSYYSCFEEGDTRLVSPVETREIEIHSLLGTRDRILNGPKWITHKSRKLSRRWKLVDADAR